MGPRALAHVLRPFASHVHPQLLVGLHTADDAAAYRVSPEQAIIQTVDFFPPIVDDPYQFGQIAAANAMSDVFAMGGEVLFALNIAGFPEDLPPSIIEAVFAGGADKVLEAGGVIAGGHTVLDAEPKYGLTVTGSAHPDRLLKKGGLAPGDRLVLTKPLGTGVITTALRAEVARPADVAAAVASMSSLNRAASRAAVGLGLRGATDVTGFGLLGHAVEMARASGVRLAIAAGSLPWLDGARAYARDGYLPGGAGRNRDYFQEYVHVGDGVARDVVDLLYDPETSGGLLLGVPPAKLVPLEDALAASGQAWSVVGAAEAREGFGPYVAVRRGDYAPRAAEE